VKGWVDAGGSTHERVFDVAGDPHNGAGVDPATCAPRGHGFHELCAVWRDPTFRGHERAFYYARVLDNPTCRWSTHVCKAGGVDPFSPGCAAQAAAAGPTWANCCLGPDNDPFLDPLVQERAWTSPIWYRPESIARVRAEVRYGAQPGTDRFLLRLVLGRVPKGFDPAREDLSLRVSDDDDILDVTFPAGRFVPARGGRFVLEGAVGPVANAALVVRKREVELQLATAPTDLSHADPVDHMVTIALAAGTYRAMHTRLWVLRHGRLMPGDG
jgi:hypothetical protein